MITILIRSGSSSFRCLQKLHPVHLGHFQIDEGQVELFPFGLLQTRHAVLRHFGIGPLFRQDFGAGHPDGLFIIDDENFGRVRVHEGSSRDFAGFSARSSNFSTFSSERLAFDGFGMEIVHFQLLQLFRRPGGEVHPRIPGDGSEHQDRGWKIGGDRLLIFWLSAIPASSFSIMRSRMMRSGFSFSSHLPAFLAAGGG